MSNKAVLNVENSGRSPFAVPGNLELACFTVAPVIAKNLRGVLLYGSRGLRPWPATVANSAHFIGEQLALYLSFFNLSFFNQMWESNAIRRKLEASVQTQAQLFIDFQHQLRSPINIAKNSYEKIEGIGQPEARRAIEVLGSSLRRVATVANNLQFFVGLAENRSITADLRLLSSERTLSDIEQASGFLYNKAVLGRDIGFEVQKKYALPLPFFFADSNLVALAIDNLLDNAVKYSYSGTSVQILAVRASYGREVYFSFRNQGLRIAPEELPHLKVRGHRGSDAKLTSPEGTGIGLWMIEKMMTAMNGRLEILPTDEEGWNDFRLFFTSSETANGTHEKHSRN